MSESPTGAGAPPSATDNFFESVRRLGLPRSDERWIGGVAGGLAHRFGIDPLIIRGLFAVSVLFGGLGMVAYGVGWLLLPEESDGRIHTQQALRGDIDIAVLGGVLAIITGFSAWTPWMGADHRWWNGLAWFIGPALVVATVALVVVAVRSRSQGSAPNASAVPSAPLANADETGPAERPATNPAATGGSMSDTAPPTAEGSSEAPGPIAVPAAPAPYLSYGSGGNYPASLPSTALPRPVRRGPGTVVFGMIGALTLLTLAGLMYADWLGLYDGPVVLTTLTVSLVLVGLAIIFSGVRGLSTGGLTALAVVGLLFAAPMTAVTSAAANGWGHGTWSSSDHTSGEVVAEPTTVAAAEDGVQLGLGSANVDLTDVPLSDDPVNVPIELGIGEVIVTLPEDTAVRVRVDVGAGEVSWVDGETVSGASLSNLDYLTEAAKDGDPAQLVLDVHVGLGSVTFEEN